MQGIIFLSTTEQKVYIFYLQLKLLNHLFLSHLI